MVHATDDTDTASPPHFAHPIAQQPNYLLFENSLGYALFNIKQQPSGLDSSAGQKSITDYGLFKDMVHLVSFAPFTDPQHSLENINAISEGVMHEFLFRFLEANLGQKSECRLGVLDLQGLGKSISDSQLNIKCYSDSSVRELMRGVRLHIEKLIQKGDSGLGKGSFEKAQLGLGHAYSRAKVKFNVKKVDNMIVHSICMLDQLDKDINTYAMRAREWYSYHFPELGKLVKDNNIFAQLVAEIGNRESIFSDEDIRDRLLAITEDEDLVEQIIEAAKSSLGFDLSEVDQLNISQFSKRLRSFQVYRAQLFNYLTSKMHTVAPNLSAVIGELVGARLISHTGSILALAKASASTLQVLGAEKALFRALKSRSGRTPKHGILFNAPSVTKSTKKNKGRIARFVANKCCMAVRIDAFSDEPTSIFGETFRSQIEDRVKQYEEGQKLNFQKNAVLMEQALEVANQMRSEDDQEGEEKAKAAPAVGEKRKRDTIDEDDQESKKEKKKRKKEKKEKKAKKAKKEKKEKKAKKSKKKKAKKE